MRLSPLYSRSNKQVVHRPNQSINPVGAAFAFKPLSRHLTHLFLKSIQTSQVLYTALLIKNGHWFRTCDLSPTRIDCFYCNKRINLADNTFNHIAALIDFSNQTHAPHVSIALIAASGYAEELATARL